MDLLSSALEPIRVLRLKMQLSILALQVRMVLDKQTRINRSKIDWPIFNHCVVHDYASCYTNMFTYNTMLSNNRCFNDAAFSETS